LRQLSDISNLSDFVFLSFVVLFAGNSVLFLSVLTMAQLPPRARQPLRALRDLALYEKRCAVCDLC
jgi:hypothetical protein